MSDGAGQRHLRPVRPLERDQSKCAGEDDRRDDVHAGDLLTTTASPGRVPEGSARAEIRGTTHARPPSGGSHPLWNGWLTGFRTRRTVATLSRRRRCGVTMILHETLPLALEQPGASAGEGLSVRLSARPRMLRLRRHFPRSTGRPYLAARAGGGRAGDRSRNGSSPSARGSSSMTATAARSVSSSESKDRDRMRRPPCSSRSPAGWFRRR